MGTELGAKQKSMNKRAKTALIFAFLMIAILIVMLFIRPPWRRSTSSTIGSGADCFAFNKKDNKFYAGCKNGHVYWLNGSTKWVDTAGPATSPVLCLAYNLGDSRLYAGDQHSNLYSYNGKTWVDAGSLLSDGIFDMTYDKHLLKLFAADNNVYSYEGGKTWEPVNNTSVAAVGCLIFSPSDSLLYAGSGKGSVYGYDGALWKDAGTPDGTYAWRLAYNEKDMKVYAGGWNGHVYRHNGGTTWLDSGNLGRTHISSLVYNPKDSKLYAGCGNTIYSYTGTKWSKVKSFDHGITCLGYNPGDSKLYASSAFNIYSYDGKEWSESSIQLGTSE
jgi:hypothetical protein